MFIKVIKYRYKNVSNDDEKPFVQFLFFCSV